MQGLGFFTLYSSCTVGRRVEAAEWLTAQRSQVPGMSAEQGLALADTRQVSGGIELSAAGR